MLLSIDHWMLLAVDRGLSQLWRFFWCLVFTVFSVYTIKITYLQVSVWSVVSSFLELALQILHSPFVFQFVPGWNKVVAAFSFVFSPFPHEGLLVESFRSSPQGVVDPAPSDRGFCSCFVLVTKASGRWRPIIVLSALISLSVVPVSDSYAS